MYQYLLSYLADPIYYKGIIELDMYCKDYYLKHGYSNSEIVNLQREISKLRSKL